MCMHVSQLKSYLNQLIDRTSSSVFGESTVAKQELLHCLLSRLGPTTAIQDSRLIKIDFITLSVHKNNIYKEARMSN